MKISPRWQKRWLRLFILLSAAALRLFGLTSAPPGLTHDEAVHGLSAWNVVSGVERPIYFAIANGREPLYDYLTALLMVFLGPTWLAPRLVSVFFGMILVAATYALIRKLFSERLAIFTTLCLALSFWPVMISRHALRTITMPVLLVLGVYFWVRSNKYEVESKNFILSTSHFPLIAGLLLGLSFYTYIPARIMWLLLPGMLLWWLLFRRDAFQAMWRPTLATLGIMGAVAAPLLIFLARNPDAESRIRDLAGPLAEARAGNMIPLLRNAAEGLRMLISIGDSAWRYNISERALILPIFAAFMGFGFILIWRYGKNSPLLGMKEVDEPTSKWIWTGNARATFVMAWFLLGMVPVFVTGPFLGTTQAIAIMPVIYIFPALLLDWVWGISSENTKVLARTMIVFLFGYLVLDTVQSYFVDWAQHPEVRLQYESVLFESISAIDSEEDGMLVYSVDAPGPYHDSAVGLLANNSNAQLKFFDGRESLLIPAGDEFTLVNTRLAPLFLFPAGENSSADIDAIVGEFDLLASELREEFKGFLFQPEGVVDFGGIAQLASFQVAPDPASQQIRILTVWEAKSLPEGDLVLFSQTLDAEGNVVAQADKLSAPVSSWEEGDVIVQLHSLQIPAELIEEENPITGSPMTLDKLIIGWYEPISGQRLPLEIDGEPAGDFLELSQ